MGWSFRRRVTLFPGVKINFSKSGISTTFGIPGASINIGPKGTYLNAGIPGTGIYNRSKIDFGTQNEVNSAASSDYIPQRPQRIFVPEEIGAIKSSDNNSITSKGISGLRDTLFAAYQEKQSLQLEINKGEDALKYTERRLNFISLIPFHKSLFKNIYGERQREYNECKDSLLEAKKQFAECKVSIKVELDNSIEQGFDILKDSFTNLGSSQYCWDVTSSVQIDRYKTRSSADHSIDRQVTGLKFSSLDFIESEYPALFFRNINGADLYFYPAFLVAFRSKTDFALVEYKDISITYVSVNFVETETIPKDSTIVGETWKYCNKNGSRDMRFSNNYEIPIALYGEIMLKSEAGLNEAYMFSNADSTKNFATNLSNYIAVAENKKKY
jgi:hypothetical protein